MQTSLSIDVGHSVLVDEDALVDLVEFLKTQYSEIKYELRCSDDAHRVPADLDEILQYDNADHNRINLLEINAKNSYEDKCSIVFGDRILSKGVTLSLSSSDSSKVNHVKATVVDKLKATKQPFYWDLVSKHAPSMICLAVLIAILLALFIVQIISPSNNSVVPKFVNWTFIDFFPYIVFGGCATVLLDKVHSYMFPKVFFYLKGQKKTYNTIKGIQMIVFGMIILAFIVGLAVNVVTNSLSN